MSNSTIRGRREHSQIYPQMGEHLSSPFLKVQHLILLRFPSANYIVAIDNKFGLVFGTSASCPVVASLITLINDARLAAGKSSVGFINPSVSLLIPTTKNFRNHRLTSTYRYIHQDLLMPSMISPLARTLAVGLPDFRQRKGGILSPVSSHEVQSNNCADSFSGKAWVLQISKRCSRCL